MLSLAATGGPFKLEDGTPAERSFEEPHPYTHEHNVPSVQCRWQDTAKRLWWKVWLQPDQITEGENNVKQNFWKY